MDALLQATITVRLAPPVTSNSTILASKLALLDSLRTHLTEGVMLVLANAQPVQELLQAVSLAQQTDRLFRHATAKMVIY